MSTNCPKCDGVMVERKGKFGTFYGCSNYPRCKHTMNSLPKIKEPVDVSELLEEVLETPKPEKQFTPSKYQQAIFDFVQNGEGNAVVEAVAGSGKSTTIIKALEFTPKDSEVAFLAFNKKIADELKERAPKHVHVSTLHSLGFSNIRKVYPKVKVDAGKVRWIIQDELENMSSYFQNIIETNMSAVIRLVSMLKATLLEPTNDNLTWIADNYNIEVNGDWQQIYQMVKIVFEKSNSETWRIDYDDMIYFCAIGKVDCKKFDWLFVDESQDLNASQTEMVLRSIHENSRVVAVGDTKQCLVDNTQILVYNENCLQKTDNGVNYMPIQELNTEDTIFTATGNGRTSTANITDKFRRYVENKDVVTITTSLGYSLTSTPEHVYFSDFINNQSKDKYYTYLMKKGNWYRIGRAAWYRSVGSTIIPGFKGRGSQEKADAMWILEICDTKEEAAYYEQFYAIKYGIPNWLFRTAGRGYNLLYNEENISRLFGSIDTENNAIKLLNDKHYDINRPHYAPKCMSKRSRRNFTITLCADNRHNSLHRYSISGSDNNDVEKLKNIGINTRPAKNGNGWKIEGVSGKLVDIYTKLNLVELALNGDVNVIEKGGFGDKGTQNLRMMPASQVLPGMFVYVYHNGKIVIDEVISNEKSTYTGFVNDINVERTHNYIANGIVVHNCIYMFRGADTNAIPYLTEKLNAVTLPLSISYRCPKSHIELAKNLVPQIEASETAKDGILETIKERELIGKVSVGDLVICRTNAPLVSPAFELIRNGIKAVILGRDIGKGLIDLIEKTEKRNSIGNLAQLSYALSEYLQEETGKLLAQNKEAKAQHLQDSVETIFALSDGCNTIPELKERIDNVFSDSQQGVVFSSIHKSKGAEAERVFILHPELMPHPMALKSGNPEALQQELNIKYVALTRSKSELYFVEE